MPYSVGCHTPLSNFEASQNYKDVDDPSIVIKFPLVEDPTVNLLIWTTGPWSLPCNLAVCVHPDLIYMKIKDKDADASYIFAESRVSMIKKVIKNFTIVEKYFFYLKKFNNNTIDQIDEYNTNLLIKFLII